MPLFVTTDPLASLHETIANKRRDWFYKLAHQLTDAQDCLYFETLNLKARQRLWGRKISDLAFYGFLQILANVARGHLKKADGTE